MGVRDISRIDIEQFSAASADFCNGDPSIIKFRVGVQLLLHTAVSNAVNLGLVGEDLKVKATAYEQAMGRHFRLFRRQYQSEIDRA